MRFWNDLMPFSSYAKVLKISGSRVFAEPLPRGRTSSSLRRNVQGTALIEFAMVAAPVIFLLLFCIEIGIRYLISANMNAGATAIIRLINSQDVSSRSSLSAPPQNQLITTACNDMGYMLPCNNKVLKVEAKVNNGFVVFQLVYHWKSIVPNFGYNIVFPDEVRSPMLFATPRASGII